MFQCVYIHVALLAELSSAYKYQNSIVMQTNASACFGVMT